MKEKFSREACLQNATAMFFLVITKDPTRDVKIENRQYSISLTMYFDEDEKEKMDKMMEMLDRVKMPWADYSEDYFEKHKFYAARYKWELSK